MVKHSFPHARNHIRTCFQCHTDIGMSQFFCTILGEYFVEASTWFPSEDRETEYAELQSYN